MLIGVPRESAAGRDPGGGHPADRQAADGLGYDVTVESGAGEAASFADDAYARPAPSIG